MINLLQIVDTVSQAAQSAQADANADGKISLMEMLKMGGWLMLPLVLLFL
jgi:biopolymer transport protein ExbB